MDEHDGQHPTGEKSTGAASSEDRAKTTGGDDGEKKKVASPVSIALRQSTQFHYNDGGASDVRNREKSSLTASFRPNAADTKQPQPLVSPPSSAVPKQAKPEDVKPQPQQQQQQPLKRAGTVDKEKQQELISPPVSLALSPSSDFLYNDGDQQAHSMERAEAPASSATLAQTGQAAVSGAADQAISSSSPPFVYASPAPELERSEPVSQPGAFAIPGIGGGGGGGDADDSDSSWDGVVDAGEGQIAPPEPQEESALSSSSTPEKNTRRRRRRLVWIGAGLAVAVVLVVVIVVIVAGGGGSSGGGTNTEADPLDSDPQATTPPTQAPVSAGSQATSIHELDRLFLFFLQWGYVFDTCERIVFPRELEVTCGDPETHLVEFLGSRHGTGEIFCTQTVRNRLTCTFDPPVQGQDTGGVLNVVHSHHAILNVACATNEPDNAVDMFATVQPMIGFTCGQNQANSPDRNLTASVSASHVCFGQEGGNDDARWNSGIQGCLANAHELQLVASARSQNTFTACGSIDRCEAVGGTGCDLSTPGTTMQYTLNAASSSGNSCFVENKDPVSNEFSWNVGGTWDVVDQQFYVEKYAEDAQEQLGVVTGGPAGPQ